MKSANKNELVSRRGVLLAGLAAAGGAVAVSGRANAQELPYGSEASTSTMVTHENMAAHGGMMTVGEVDNVANGFDPMALLTDWDVGTTEILPDGRTLRTFEVQAEDKEIEIAPGVFYPAWTFNGRVPGPALRATEGDRIRIIFKNYGSHPHSMHFHGIHSARMDGVNGTPGLIGPGEEFTYEFDAKPFGCHLYHCHALPLKRHMAKGMYGAFIVDPDPKKHVDHNDVARSRLKGTAENAEWQELVMVMNAFDTNFDEENEFYAANTIPFAYMKKPIRIEKSRPVRIYLINTVEFDPINSFHLHGNFFDYYNQGTTLTPTLRTVDIITQCQAERGILEFSFAEHEPGLYMFHAHQAEFTELGWMANFDVVEA
ncbi:multicopper oxidase domain-containing protein [Maritalea porphyrae]|uniref:multicopper oxidase domain-containing protein n=1 Tax=Maritalea porphyrae TaxID=880732 RepID=UPI0022AFCB55|nr:multicopper oxidase domain-containing protein [Maritalea porphyrae]MCZ4273346.1 multicopper oxidase domain-containing protein [Maritalea porphyrae]